MNVNDNRKAHKRCDMQELAGVKARKRCPEQVENTRDHRADRAILAIAFGHEVR